MPKETFFNLNDEKKERILRAAINEFLEKGFEKGNIGNIAKKAEVAKGSMYQYFENKKELFLFSIQWSLEFIYEKYNKYEAVKDKDINIFDFSYETSKNMWVQLQDEKEMCIFIQNVFFGKYGGITDESISNMMKISDKYTLELIRKGKENGSIRKDIDDNMILIFMTGVSIRFKEDLMKRVRSEGSDIMNNDFESFDNDIKRLLELLKNGMGAN
ncbi:TetR/AcrR family transcriptional regulator [Clostridium pasteurianum]|uniref:Transcriptional regulator n=1 Tax=Clostridium pasteurianum BC1 TaxID=86416 RepID=R4K872_CLOPA|nr:TetR/AcrR family transcriptional regulator [Clostridium pasteurianum]AGK99377.1 transcriptional regulator [Clostridium pasteurianum BC1]